MNLNPLNVRKGLELEEVEVYDIFHIDTESFGEPEAKTIHEIGWSSYSKNNKNNPVIKKIKDESGVIYFTHKIERDVTETLKAFIYDCYMVFVDKLDTSIVSSSLNTEIQFVNTKTLDFSQFCKNLMEAQAFCGDYNIPDLKYSFAGHGDFTIQDYSDVHHLVIFSRIHMLDFFITCELPTHARGDGMGFGLHRVCFVTKV